MRKLIAVDVDGTLINSDMKISEKTRKTLIEAQKQGHKVVISSGRSPRGVMDFALELEMDKYESYIANYNGAVVTDVMTNEKPIDHRFEIEFLREILQFIDTIDIDYMIYFEDKVYTSDSNTYRLKEVKEKNFDIEIIVDPELSKNIDFMPNNILLSQEESRIKEPADELIEKYGDRTSMMYSAPYFFEIMPKDVSKGHSLLEIADYLEIDHKDVIAFGDEGNDMKMIEMAGVGVAMGNAIPELKEIADYVTLTNDEDGIADYLEKYVL